MNDTHLNVSCSDGHIPVHRYTPASSGPLLVVVPSIFGHSPDVATFATDFAGQGALVYVVDSFWRDVPGPLKIPDQGSAAMARMRRLDPEDGFADLLAVIDEGLKDPLCNGRLLLLGICFGGTFVVRATQHRNAMGLAVWHGAGLLPWISKSALSEVSMSLDFGGVDPLIPIDEVELIRQELHGLKVEIRVHADAKHKFTLTMTAII